MCHRKQRQHAGGRASCCAPAKMPMGKMIMMPMGMATNRLRMFRPRKPSHSVGQFTSSGPGACADTEAMLSCMLLGHRRPLQEVLVMQDTHALLQIICRVQASCQLAPESLGTAVRPPTAATPAHMNGELLMFERMMLGVYTGKTSTERPLHDSGRQTWAAVAADRWSLKNTKKLPVGSDRSARCRASPIAASSSLTSLAQWLMAST